MDTNFWKLLSDMLPSHYQSRAEDAIRARQRRLNHVLIQAIQSRRIPEDAWEDSDIEALLNLLASMDSNNFYKVSGVGEREGRVFSAIVKRRNYGMIHGIGRSGDLAELQPKALGSSLLNMLSNALALSVIHISGISKCKKCIIIPVATGMAMTLCLMNFRKARPQATHVIWSRVDQKSCIKCITAIEGLTLHVVEQIYQHDRLCTNVPLMQETVEFRVNPNLFKFPIVLQFSIELVSELCDQFDIPHLVNNAYGLQSSKLCSALDQANRRGRVDLFVQSVDKNFMMPVGGSIVGGFKPEIVDSLSKLYPGRASASVSMDFLTTMLAMGERQYQSMRSARVGHFQQLHAGLQAWAAKTNEQIINCPKNNISIAVSLDRLAEKCNDDINEITRLGSMLFSRNVTGARVVPAGVNKIIEGIEFKNWGAHSSIMRRHYFNAAAAIGMQLHEIERFLSTLESTLPSSMIMAWFCMLAVVVVLSADLVANFHYTLDYRIRNLANGVSSGAVRDCYDVQKQQLPLLPGGFFMVDVPCSACLACGTGKLGCSKMVRCDLETDGGGWTIIQRRENPLVDFNGNWAEYRDGFGDENNFWIGNEYLHQISNYRLRNGGLKLCVELLDDGNEIHVDCWTHFYVASEYERYLLLLGIYKGSSKYDNFLSSRGRVFATYDNDNSAMPVIQCASYWQTGWWMNLQCRPEGTLNLPLQSSPSTPYIEGIFWRTRNQGLKHIVKTVMRIRPMNVRFDF
ncbi:O-phosphoseryl-tRNA(Sec) selenium transferase [Trichinella spiralis]|uniref:O-phosphoseryl-tRNA(Sec) selenium transferase n=1 Tax=Trichinella spiralis TaxID=6334 RepID=A0A0V1B2Y6_TRISP|nr:O-phosphoseryl-tRNA(Sec) selenium transferase [Trichinella spiralis]